MPRNNPKITATAIKVVREKIPVGQAMREAGYTNSASLQPQKITRTEQWQRLMDKYLPDDDLTKIHKKLLKKKEVVVVSDGKAGSHIEYTGQIHSDAAKALDMAYKLKGSYAPEKQRLYIEPLTPEQMADLDKLLLLNADKTSLGQSGNGNDSGTALPL